MPRSSHRRSSTSRPLALLLAVATCASLWVGLSGEARADLYRYQMPDGSVLITTEPRSGLKLLERIGDGGGSSGGGSSSGGGGRTISKKFQAARDRAIKARDDHKAGRGEGEAESTARYEDRFDDIIHEASTRYQIPFAFIKGVIKVESNFNPLVVSPVGAQGLMQLMPGTADFLGVDDAFDPRQNIFGGTKLLRILTNKYNGDINLILSAYNAGDGAVARYDGIPYAQTREYVRRVYHHYKVFQRRGQEADRD